MQFLINYEIPLDKREVLVLLLNYMKNSKGFTLIELLIVIALLGALAIGLLAALDPFEQLKKGEDTGIRNTVSEIHGAAIRYYAVKNQFPTEWNTSFSGAATDYSAPLLSVIGAGELKPDFFTLAGGQLAKIQIIGTTESLTVCFQPKSKSFRSDNNTKYLVTGVEADPANCPLATSTECYWCIR